MKYGFIFILSISIYLFPSCSDKDEAPTACEANCDLAPEVGPCNAAFPRYYFDKTEKKCKEFIWGGCAGVVPFESLAECEACGCQ